VSPVSCAVVSPSPWVTGVTPSAKKTLPLPGKPATVMVIAETSAGAAMPIACGALLPGTLSAAALVDGGVVSRISASVLLVPVLPARSVARAVMLCPPSPDSATAVLQLPPLAVVVPTRLPLSNSAIVGLAARFASETVPVIVCVACLVKPPLLLIATAGATVSRVSASVLLVPVLPARSLALAVMLCAPSPDSVIDALHTPPLAVVVPTGLPLSNSVIVGLAARLASLTVPAIVCVAWLVIVPLLVMATAGAVVSRVMVSDAVPVPPGVVSRATSVCVPSASPVGEKLHTPAAAFATVVPSVTVPSVMITVAFAAPPPVTAGLAVRPSLDDAPVSATSVSVTGGGGDAPTTTLLPPAPSSETVQPMPV
jgi:hypothetical protein